MNVDPEAVEALAMKDPDPGVVARELGVTADQLSDEFERPEIHAAYVRAYAHYANECVRKASEGRPCRMDVLTSRDKARVLTAKVTAPVRSKRNRLMPL